MSTAFRQDMPPSGGYAPVHYERVPTKKILNGEWLERSQFGNDIFVGWWMLGITLCFNAFGAYRFWQTKYYKRFVDTS